MALSLKPLQRNILTIPLSFVYSICVALRNWIYDTCKFLSKSLRSPVISVGGIHAGGTGKTPLTINIADHLIKRDITPSILSRGYGRDNSASTIIIPPYKETTWEETGDEPAMIRNRLENVWLGLSKHRCNAGSLIEKRLDNTIFILDDGFQHRKLKRDIDIVCLPPDPFKDRMIPTGYLREPLSSIQRASYLFITGLPMEYDTMCRTRERLSETFNRDRIIFLFSRPLHWINLSTGETQKKPGKGRRLLISGIANPTRFIKMVRESGLAPFKSITYNDHHRFTSEEINNIGIENYDTVLCTEKDSIRFSSINLDNRKKFWYLIIKNDFVFGDQKNSFLNTLEKTIA